MKRIVISVSELFRETGTAKLCDLGRYEEEARKLAWNGNEVVLTGQGPIWLYLRIQRALRGLAARLVYDSPVTGEIVIFDHDPR